jgi:hypothetical protein
MLFVTPASLLLVVIISAPCVTPHTIHLGTQTLMRRPVRTWRRRCLRTSQPSQSSCGLHADRGPSMHTHTHTQAATQELTHTKCQKDSSHGVDQWSVQGPPVAWVAAPFWEAAPSRLPPLKMPITGAITVVETCCVATPRAPAVDSPPESTLWLRPISHLHYTHTAVELLASARWPLLSLPDSGLTTRVSG